MKTLAPCAEISIAIVRDEYGTFRYSFIYGDEAHQCYDFERHEDALSGARFHIRCLAENLPYEVVDGLGAVFRG